MQQFKDISLSRIPARPDWQGRGIKEQDVNLKPSGAKCLPQSLLPSGAITLLDVST